MLKNNNCFNQILISNERVIDILNIILNYIGLDVDMLDTFINMQLHNSNIDVNKKYGFSGSLKIHDNVIIDYYHNYANYDKLILGKDLFQQAASLIEILSVKGRIIIEGYKNSMLIKIIDDVNGKTDIYEITLDSKKNQIYIQERISLNEEINLVNENAAVHSYKK